MIELLAALSLSAAAGFRVALPLLAIGLSQGETLWQNVPLLSHLDSQVLLGVLVSWSISEVFLSKWPLGQRILQSIQLFLCPIVGAIAGLTVFYFANNDGVPLWPIGLACAALALVLQLVQVGWFYRLKGLPLWSILLQDTICLILVLSAFDAPQEGGIIALLLLWLAVRSPASWKLLQRQKRLMSYSDQQCDGRCDGQSYSSGNSLGMMGCTETTQKSIRQRPIGRDRI